jgi:hypothetical protein
VSLVAPALESARAAERSRERARTLTPWLIGCCYALGAVAVTCRLWADPATRAQAGDVQDVNLFAWFMRYEATAIAHGRLPALTTAALNPPHGVSLMWNTSLLLPGVLLAPVTLLAGPLVTLTLVLTLGFAGSAASLYLVLRRWGASLAAAAIGGAVYGFSPALLNSGIGHYHLQFAVLPPLIIDALLRIVTGRGGAMRIGIWLGVLAAAQLFTGEELLSDTALACLVLVLVLVASQPRGVSVKARHAAIGIATGVAVMLVICGRALWEQFRGPLTEHYAPRFTHYTSFLSAHPSVFVTPPGDLLFHTSASAAVAAAYPGHMTEYLAYLGWPLLVLLVAAAIRYWRHPPVRVMAVTFAVLELLSLGGSYRVAGPFLPWHWLQGLPVFAELIPDRLAIFADGAAAAVLAFALDRARQEAPVRGDHARAGPARLAVCVCPAAPGTGRPGARGPDPGQSLQPADALAGGHRRARLDDRRVLPRAEPGRADQGQPGARRDRRAVSGPALDREDTVCAPVHGTAPRRRRVLAPGRRHRRPAPALPARPGTDRAVRPPGLQGRPTARLAALATWA